MTRSDLLARLERMEQDVLLATANDKRLPPAFNEEARLDALALSEARAALSELALIQEAAADESLSAEAVRAVARGVKPPTADDVAWAARAALEGQPTAKAGVCAKCGGPHPFDTSVPSHQWNRVIRAAGLPDYLCTTCIVAAFVLAKEGFTAELYGRSDGQGDPLDESAEGFDLHGDAIEVRVGGRDLETVGELRDENNRLRSALGELDREHPLLAELCRPPEPQHSHTGALTMARWWVMWVDGWRLKFIHAEGPCWKGELQIGPLVFGWQREP